MPHTNTAKKRLRQNAKRRLQNRAVKKTLKLQIKKVLAISAENTSIEELRKELIVAVRKLDKAAAKRVIHPNLAARKKSQLSKMVHRKTTPAPAATAGS